MASSSPPQLRNSTPLSPPPNQKMGVEITSETSPLLAPTTVRFSSSHLGPTSSTLPLTLPTTALAAPPPRRRYLAPDVLLIATLICMATLFGTIVIQNKLHSNPSDSLHLFEGTQGVVSSDVEECSRIGVATLQEGGNAVDAAIATGACIGTVNMYASGIGGGGFMVVRMNNGDAKAFNFREMAPGTASKDMFKGRYDQARRGGLAVGVPGELHGYATAHQAFGVLPWATLWRPSIALARNGFRVSKIFYAVLRPMAEFFTANRPDWEFLFSAKTDGLAGIGEMIYRPNFAETLETIAGDGVDEYAGVRNFYNGSIAEKIVAAVQASGGIITLDDLRRYYTAVEPTITTTFNNRTIHTCPAPCSGPSLLFALNIAEHLELPHTPASAHLVVEAMKHLSASRTELGDPTSHASRKNAYNASLLLSPLHGAAVAATIHPNHTKPWQHYNPRYLPNSPAGTSHISVLDAQGNAASLTTTINLYFGNLHPDPETGIIFNSQMDDFSVPGRDNAFDLRPSKFNLVGPGLRPLSSCTPTIITANDTLELVIGGSGGSRIVTAVFEGLVKRIKWGTGKVEMVRDGRMHHQLLPEEVMVEASVRRDVVRALKERGHTVRVRAKGEAGGSVLHVVGVDDAGEGKGRAVWGVADWWRKGGKAWGY